MANKTIDELRKEIAELPSGYISKKFISGKTYPYYQYTEEGKKKSRYLQPEEAEALEIKIQRKKVLKAQIKALQQGNHPDLDKTYILMHRDEPVCSVLTDQRTGQILAVLNGMALDHAPVGVSVRSGKPDRDDLNNWWMRRAIPASRVGIENLLEGLGLSSPQALLTKSFGLSLSDHYWLKPEDSDVSWDAANFFDNPFSEDVGGILFGSAFDSAQTDLNSPDVTSDGYLKKRWRIINGKRYLIKAGTQPAFQQPFNEVIVSLVCDRLAIPYVQYDVVWDKGLPYSRCEDFADQDTELVPAAHILQTMKQANDESKYAHFLRCCDGLGIVNARDSLERMMVLDYIIANEDRHFNNFGFLRSSKTLEFIGFAPVYDSGSSLGFDKLTGQIKAGLNIGCKPFARTHQDQIKLVKDFKWICFDALLDVPDQAREILMSAGPYADEQRIDAIVNGMSTRIEQVKVYAGKMV